MISLAISRVNEGRPAQTNGPQWVELNFEGAYLFSCTFDFRKYLRTIHVVKLSFILNLLKISYPVVWTAHGAIFIKQNLRYVLTYDLTCNPNSALPLFITKDKITLIYYILCTCFLPFLRNFSFSTSRLLKILQALKFMISDGCPHELDFSKMKEPKHLCS